MFERAPPFMGLKDSHDDCPNHELMDVPQSAQTPDGKPGQELALWAEGFFRLDFLLLFYQEKSSSPRGNERREHFIETKIF